MKSSGDRPRVQEVRDRAIRARQRLSINDTVELREQIVETARESGVLHIWLEVFNADMDMRKRFCLAFVGA